MSSKIEAWAIVDTDNKIVMAAGNELGITGESQDLRVVRLISAEEVGELLDALINSVHEEPLIETCPISTQTLLDAIDDWRKAHGV